MPGRKPLGPQLAQHLDGSIEAKERLEVILQTLSGQLKVAEACARLGIGEAMFHRLRMEVLQAGLSRLEPRPLGRPPRPRVPEAIRVVELEHDLKDLQLELKTTRVQLEIAQTLPHLLTSSSHEKNNSPAREESVVKKTTPPQPR
jgi:transposase-like protein